MQRAEGEPDALLQVLGLGEGGEIDFEASCSAAEAMACSPIHADARSGGAFTEAHG